MILRRQNMPRGTPLGSPELVMIAPRLGVSGEKRPAPEPPEPLASHGVTLCCWCKRWKHEEELAQGHAKLEQHRLSVHPDKTPRKRRHRKKKAWQQLSYGNLDDNIAGARAQGGARWADEDAA